MGFRRRTRRRALIAGAAIAHHEDNRYAEQQQAYQAPADVAPDPAQYRRLRWTRRTRSNISPSCMLRAFSPTRSSRRPRPRP